MKLLSLAVLFFSSKVLHSQDLAPAELNSPWSLAYSRLVDNGGAIQEINGAISSANTSAFSYLKTGETTGTLTYTLESGIGGLDFENGTVQLAFINTQSGTFTYSAIYHEYHEDGYEQGSVSGSGTFTFNTPSTKTFPSIAVSDDFNDSPKDLTKWGPDEPLGAPGTLAEADQRLTFSADDADDRGSYRQWTGSVHGYNEAWEVIVDAGSLQSFPTSSGISAAGMGLSVYTPGNLDQIIFISLNASLDAYLEEGIKELEVVAGLSDLESMTFPLTAGQASFRIAFNPINKVFTIHCDPNGPLNGHEWIEIATVGISAVGGGALNEDWGMTGNDPFVVDLFGFSSGRPVAAGEMFLDNFRIGATPPPVASAIALWAEQQFGSANAPDSGLVDDKDKDGHPNIIEYAFGLNPNAPGDPILTPTTGVAGLPLIRPIETPEGPQLVIEFVRRKVSSNPGISYQAQFSSDLSASGPQGWQAATAVETVTSIDANWERVTVRDHAPAGASQRFGRVQVTAVP